jgi:hypothetical protein
VRDLPHADPRRILTATGPIKRSASGTDEDDTSAPGPDRAELDRTSTQRSLITMAEALRGVRTHDRARPGSGRGSAADARNPLTRNWRPVGGCGGRR